MPDKASVTDRHPGWFVESKGKPLAGDLPSRHASTPRWLIVLAVLSVALLILGIYFAFVPWSGCGISVMGRYDHSSPPDSAATFAPSLFVINLPWVKGFCRGATSDFSQLRSGWSCAQRIGAS